MFERVPPGSEMAKDTHRRAVRSADDLVALVEDVGECYVFKRGPSPRVVDFMEGGDATSLRGIVLAWSEASHLGQKLFLSVDEAGSLLVMSMDRVQGLLDSRSHTELTRDEARLLGRIDHSMTTPELREAARLPRRRFKKALAGLRFKMRIALVDVRKESRTKHVNRYDRIERFLRGGGLVS